MLYCSAVSHHADTDSVVRLFLEHSRTLLAGQYWPRLRDCVESLTDEQIWWRPNEASNSVGNLLMHLNGNVRQWLVVTFANAQDGRDRPAEFARRTHLPRSVLLDDLAATVDQAANVIRTLSTADLLATVKIQGYTTTGLEAVYHVIEHFSMHYGQIVFITKQLRGADLGFYRELDATGHARE